MDAGVAMAYGRGYFKQHRLAVAVLSPLTPMRPIRYVVEGVDDFGVAAAPQVALARQKGTPIVAVGSLVPRPTATMMWLRGSKIHAVADLRGKIIGIPGLPFQRDLLDAVLKRAGVAPGEVKVVQEGYGLAAKLASRRVDAIFGGSRSVEGAELESRGLDPVVTPVGRLGIPPYEEMVWVARKDFAQENPGVVRGFIAAVRQGGAAAKADPAAAARMVEKSAERNRHLSPAQMEAGVRATAPRLSRTAHMSRPRTRRLLRWMHAQGLIQRRLPVSALQTNVYLN